jgi:glycosyltransferase involved in cell wall biosynthesis
MPVYNAGAYLSLAIHSILDQTFTDYELLLMDDGSIDGSWDVIQQFAQKDKRIIAHRFEHMGHAQLFNYGLNLAKSQLIAGMHADDIAMPNRLEMQLFYMQNHPQIQVLGTAYKIMAQDHPTQTIVRFPTNSQQVTREMARTCCVAHPTVMFRKQSVLNVSGYQSHFLPCEDYDLWLRLLARQKDVIANLPEPLLYYRYHQNQISHVRALDSILYTKAAQIAYLHRLEGRPDPFSQTDKISYDDVAALMDDPENLKLLCIIGFCDRIAFSKRLGFPTSNYQPMETWLNEFADDTKSQKFAEAWMHLSMASNYHGYRYYIEIASAILRGFSSSAFRKEFTRLFKERQARLS